MKHAKEEYQEIINKCFSKADFAKILGYEYWNGTVGNILNKIIKDNNLSIKHFDGGKSKKIRYPKVTKNCPVCEREFQSLSGAPKEKQTCSYACSNKKFRSGVNNGISKQDGIRSYRWICFSEHKKECIICGESNILSVHHFDENHENNEPTNLVPMCPTHHQYMHSNYKHLIEDKVKQYVNNRV